MSETFNNKINILKALAILLVVSGHLEFSLIPLFPPYSFQIALFFFISGMLYKEKYGFIEFFKRRFKSLMVPYILYCIVYLIITILIAPYVGKFWAMPVTFKNEFIMPFLTGHQIDLISPLWFVVQLFTSLIVYKILNYIKINPYLRFLIYFLFALCAIQLSQFAQNLYILYFLRTIFSLLFIHAGFLFYTKIKDNHNIFTPKIFYFVIILQALLWLTNKDYTPQDGIGLSYILIWGEFDNWIVPILTSFSGIWMSLFLVDVFYEKVKNWNFLHKIGQNTYHIMANHLLVFNFITYFLLYIKGIDFNIKNNSDIYWFYCPLKSTYFYFISGIILTTYLGEFLKKIKSKIKFIK